MGVVRWIGTATAVAQVDTFTPANVEIDDIFTLTVTGIDGRTYAVNYTATAATVANVTAGITAAWNNDSDALTTGITAADGTTNMTLTADEPGDAFSVASSATDGGGTDTQTFTRAATTASGGPKHWDDTGNWDGAALPGASAGDEVFVEDFATDILYGLDQSGIANTLTSLNIPATFTGKLGPDGATGYAGDYLQIKASALNIGQHYAIGSPRGSGRIKIDLGSTQCEVNIFKTGSPSDTTKPAVRLKANSASTDVTVHKGSVGVAFESGETSTVGDVSVRWTDTKSTDSSMFLGDGVTITSLNQTAGECTLRSACTTVTNSGGTLLSVGTGTITTLNCDGGTTTTFGTGAVTTMNVTAGTAIPSSTGTVTTMNLTGGTTDMTRSTDARTVTTVNLDKGATFKYDPAVVTLTNNIDSTDTVSLKAS
jgi:hypothetical protein